MKKPSSSHIAPGISISPYENKTPFTEIFIVLRIQLRQSQIITRVWNSDSMQRKGNSRKEGREVSSKYMASGGGGGSSDDSWVSKTHKAMKKANNSVIGYVSSRSHHWPLPHHGHISLRPQHNSVEKIMSSMGFDLFKHKKPSNDEVVHELRLLDNRLNQWRFANARAHSVNNRMCLVAEGTLKCAVDDLANLRYTVVLSKIEFERQKLELKLDCILHSQKKLLDVWGSIERRHVAAVTILKDCLYSVACRVHLVDGEMDIELTSIAQRHAVDLTDSIESLISSFTPLADKTAELMSELAEVVTQERFLLMEFDDIFHTIRALEHEERRQMCNLIQLYS